MVQSIWSQSPDGPEYMESESWWSKVYGVRVLMVQNIWSQSPDGPEYMESESWWSKVYGVRVLMVQSIWSQSPDGPKYMESESWWPRVYGDKSPDGPKFNITESYNSKNVKTRIIFSRTNYKNTIVNGKNNNYVDFSLYYANEVSQGLWCPSSKIT